MIISPTTGTGFAGALSYIHKEYAKGLREDQKPKILQENFVFGTIDEQARLMRNIALCNPRSSRPVLHLSVSFHKEEKISPEVRDLIFDKILEELEASRDNHQFVIAQHFDADHEHYHILLNKVGVDRTNISTNYIVNRCQVIADKIEIELGLRRTYGRTVVYDPSPGKGYRYTREEERNPKNFLDKVEKIRDAKADIETYVQEVLSDTTVKTISDFVHRLEEKNIDTRLKYDSENVLRGISFKYDNLSYKASKLGIKVKAIEAQLKSNSLVVEEDKTPEKPWREELDAIKLASQNRYAALHEFKLQYQESASIILDAVKKGEESVDQLFSVFEEKGFKREGDYFHNGSFRFSILKEKELILKNIDAVKSCKRKYEDEKIAYQELMKTPLQSIPFWTLPSKRKELELKRSILENEKNNAIEPALNLWGLVNNDALLQSIEANINKESDIISDTNKKILEKLKEEKALQLERDSKLKISEAHIKEYTSKRNSYKYSEEYIGDFIKNYEHESEIKDLFWLDAKFESLANDEERIKFLQNEFGVSEEAVQILKDDFYLNDPNLIKIKVMWLNKLDDRLIRAKDEIEKPKRKNIIRL